MTETIETIPFVLPQSVRDWKQCLADLESGAVEMSRAELIQLKTHVEDRARVKRLALAETRSAAAASGVFIDADTYKRMQYELAMFAGFTGRVNAQLTIAKERDKEKNSSEASKASERERAAQKEAAQRVRLTNANTRAQIFVSVVREMMPDRFDEFMEIAEARRLALNSND